MPIHTAPDHIRELAKYELERTMWDRYHMTLADIPFISGVGIGDSHIVVTTEDELPAIYREYIPNEVARIPVLVRNVGPCVREEPAIDEYGFYFQMRQRGTAGVAQGGAVIHGRESGSCFGVLVNAQGQRYAVCSSHVLGPPGRYQASIGGRNIGQVVKDLRHCNGSTHVDASAVQLNQGVQANPTMIGLNAVCAGFVKPQVGQTVYTSGANSGNTTQKITTTNYSLRNDTGGNCSTNFQDVWIGSVRSKPGDSGSNMVVKQGNQYLSVGILTTNNQKGSVNCSSWYMQQEFGITGFLQR
jgi:hypothetical protein